MHGGLALAADPWVEKQRQIQNTLFDRFTQLDKRLNQAEKQSGKSQAAADMPVYQPVEIIDPAFVNGERDPFMMPLALKQQMQRLQQQSSVDRSQLYAFSRINAQQMPKIRLKGVMHKPGKRSPLAVIEMNDETFMVRESDEVGFNIADPSQVIKIKKIDRLSLLVEVGTLGELLIIR